MHGKILSAIVTILTCFGPTTHAEILFNTVAKSSHLPREYGGVVGKIEAQVSSDVEDQRALR
jgi:hypothetical protein